ncbi:hypothetical protein IQ06DRAFT_306502 [Phaeosphaeriaceae sp. SRC1lsM3a]|nr:hypothetical protein IQ06DRAFT_306502 [Stagonospora sp. SRC1lsM3a]
MNPQSPILRHVSPSPEADPVTSLSHLPTPRLHMSSPTPLPSPILCPQPLPSPYPSPPPLFARPSTPLPDDHNTTETVLLTCPTCSFIETYPIQAFHACTVCMARFIRRECIGNRREGEYTSFPTLLEAHADVVAREAQEQSGGVFEWVVRRLCGLGGGGGGSGFGIARHSRTVGTEEEVNESARCRSETSTWNSFSSW